MNTLLNPAYEALAERAATRVNYGAVVDLLSQTTSFLVWAPAASNVRLALYETYGTLHRQLFDMISEDDGCFTLKLPEDLSGKYYTYLLKYETDDKVYEITDPWARAASPNSKRGLIVDPRQWDPPGFRSDPIPPASDYGRTVIYELSVRDFTAHPSSGTQFSGLYLGLTEEGTTCYGMTTGLDHLAELGVTHIHLLPIQDFVTTDEHTREPYNWGYDPMLFDVPEGSYATDPVGGRRITELKSLIQSLHKKGLRVVLDVVYNHTFESSHAHYQRLAPNYYYRMTDCGFSNGSGCGNELATERIMVHKRILDSLFYWTDEYLVDGFRFDLMGLFDRKTVQKLSRDLLKHRPDLLLYAEPWAAGASILPEEERFFKGRQRGLGLAIFDDDFRNLFIGGADDSTTGFIQNNVNFSDFESVKNLYSGICAGIACAQHPGSLADSPSEIIHYLASHDNLILRDKLESSLPDANESERLELTCLSYNILLTSFGYPLIHSGTEFYRTKFGNSNSYNAGDEINAVRWTQKSQYHLLHEHIQKLIVFRKETGLFSKSPASIRQDFLPIEGNFLAYQINQESYAFSFYHNPGDIHLVLPNINRGEVQVVLDGLKWFPETEIPLKVPAKGSLILKSKILNR
jgi:pullulanase